ncbi:MAG: hypothetical protein J2P27_15660 [Actinobacteria bacterium]|nr:hypothetical protein [Actinomycetota bacterium]
MAGDLLPQELRPTGGNWGGIVFANPAAAVDPALTWSFTFDFEEITRDYGDVTPGLTVEWAALPDYTSWREFSGAELACGAFGKPVEASVYYFEHYRYDAVQLAVLEQDGGQIRAHVTVSGDLDDLGITELTAEARLNFAGIIVQLPERPTSVQEAAAELARFTSVDGLRGMDRGHNYVFVAAT